MHTLLQQTGARLVCAIKSSPASAVCVWHYKVQSDMLLHHHAVICWLSLDTWEGADSGLMAWNRPSKPRGVLPVILEQSAAMLSAVLEGRTGLGAAVGGTLSPVSPFMPPPKRPWAAGDARFLLGIWRQLWCLAGGEKSHSIFAEEEIKTFWHPGWTQN